MKYLLSRKRQTILTLLGIFFGTAAYVVISGFFLGFRGYLIQQLVNNSGHVHIQSREDFVTEHSLDQPFFGKDHVKWISPPARRIDEDLVENPSEWFLRLDNDPRVSAYSPILRTAVILSKGQSEVTSTLIGCNPEKQIKVTKIAEDMKEGKFSDLSSGGNKIILGIELKKKLGVRLSQNIQVSLAQGSTRPFKVVGVYESGNKLNDINAYGSLQDVQRVNRTPNQINEITVRLKDYELAQTMSDNWKPLAQEKVESWNEQNARIFNVFKIQDAVRFLSIFSIMIVASFGIYNVLNITVIQKRKDIAILSSLGFDYHDILILFLSQGLLLGFSGAILGLIVGYFICLYLQTVPFGGGPMGGAGFLQISLDTYIYVSAFSLAIFSTSLASILPARAAGKLTPIDIIRSGAE